jgi:hypothetical protein
MGLVSLPHALHALKIIINYVSYSSGYSSTPIARVTSIGPSPVFQSPTRTPSRDPSPFSADTPTSKPSNSPSTHSTMPSCQY